MRTLQYLTSSIVVFCVLIFLTNITLPGLAEAQTADTLWSENWESGIGNWYADNGVWEVGVPTVGPNFCHSGSQCSGTILDGNYPARTNSRLISPYISLPSVTGEEKIVLKFWQWFNIENNYDKGFLQISVNNGNWQTINGPQFDGFSALWSQYVTDISSFADSTIRISFLFTSDHVNESNGWYIDDIIIEKCKFYFRNPEDFEIGIKDWSVDNGLWQVGIPTAGPPNAHSGQNVAGIVLDGNYSNNANTRLISPEIILHPLSGQTPSLFFWHWFRIENNYDKGRVQIKVKGRKWQDISNNFTGNSGGWTQFAIPDLSAYADSTVQFAFYFQSDGSNTDIGWYIDDIRIEGVVNPNENNPPNVVVPIPDTTFQEDSGLHLISEDLNTVFSDPDGDDLTFSTSSDNVYILPSIHGDSLFVTSSENYFGSGNVFVTATDPDGLSAKDTFMVTITPVNDAPGEFNLLAPADKDTVDTLSTPIQFVWSQAENVDQDTIWYDLKIFNAGFDTSITNLTDTTFTFYGESILQYNSSYQWTVMARDRYEYTQADTFLFYTPEATSIHYVGGAIPRQFALEQNYPNPFNPVTTIKYALPKAGRVKLEVFNLLGQKVAALVDGHVSAGYHKVTFNGISLPSGVYYYRLQTDGGFVQTRKLVLLK